MKKIIFSILFLALCLSGSSFASVAQAEEDTYADRDNVFWNQLVMCEDFDSVWYIAHDGSRYVIPNEKTFYSWKADFSDVVEIACDDLSEFPLAGSLPYQSGTRYLKLQSDPTVYAVEPMGVLRAIPNERWMEVFVGEGWADHIDDLPDGFWSHYTVGEPLALMEIPDGMTAQDPETEIWYYFVDGQPKSLEGISFHYNNDGHFRNYTRTFDDAPGMYERVGPALPEGTRIGTPEELYLGKPMMVDTGEWVYEEDFPVVPIIR